MDSTILIVLSVWGRPPEYKLKVKKQYNQFLSLTKTLVLKKLNKIINKITIFYVLELC